MVKWVNQKQLKAKKSSEREKEIINILLANRKIKSDKDSQNFFNPPAPLEMLLEDAGIDGKETLKAIKRIIKAVSNDQTIIVYGDYDADGITGTAILWEILYLYSKKARPYLPDRVKEGYGLTKIGIDNIISQFNPSLIITVDHGVTAIKAVEYAKTKGIEVIITDHHVLPKIKPKPYALLHSTKISGSAVAWFLAREFLKFYWKNKKIPEPAARLINDGLGLCAIGTVADIIPLLGVNRSIVKKGIEILRNTKRPGLFALFKEAGILQSIINTYHISFMIAPRINASGRLTHALDSLRLICTTSLNKAEEFARQLGATNRQRQKLTDDTWLLAKANLNNKNKILFTSHESFNQGIIGLVAGKLVEEYYLPAIVISKGDRISKASARSIGGFNIISAIKDFSDLLVDCGGHPMAAGFTIQTSRIDKFIRQFAEKANKTITQELLVKTLNIDCELELSDLTYSFNQNLERFKPFGVGNSEPLFAIENLTVLEIRTVGKGNKHLKISLCDKKRNVFNGIAFNKGQLYSKISKDKPVNIAASLIMDDWNGGSLQLKILDLMVK